MARPTAQPLRTTTFAALTAFLVAMIVGLSLLLRAVVTKAESSGAGKSRLPLIVLAASLLILSILILAVVVIHYISSRVKPPIDRAKPTPFESAWDEAGKRLKPEDAPPVEPYEDKDKDT
jgi:hypothetical protein